MTNNNHITQFSIQTKAKEHTVFSYLSKKFSPCFQVPKELPLYLGKYEYLKHVIDMLLISKI
jgi:hypothetical protein